MRRTKRTLAILAFTLASCTTQVIPASTPTSNVIGLRLYATTAAMPLLTDLTIRYSQLRPEIVFETLSGSYEAMLNRLLDGEMPYFLTNHLPVENALWAAPLAQDGIAIIVHPDNPIPALTTSQLRAIYQGHIANWREVGGDDRDLVVISREDGSGTRAEFERLVMGERRTTRSAQVAPSSAAVVASVAQQPGAIGYISMSYLDDRVRAVPIDDALPTPDTVYDHIYPLRTTLFVVGLEEPANDYLAFFGWIQSQEGQRVVGEKYAPLLRLDT